MRCDRWRLLSAACVVVFMAACSTRTVPALPAVLAHPEFVYPAVPLALASVDSAGRIDRGWRFLQNGNLTSAGASWSAIPMRH